MTTLRPAARPVNPCTEHNHVEGDDCPSAPFFTFGQAVKIAAPALASGQNSKGEMVLRDYASPMARRHHGRVGVVIYVERCDRERVPRMLYSVALYPATRVRLYACELERYDGERRAIACCHGCPPDQVCGACESQPSDEGGAS